MTIPLFDQSPILNAPTTGLRDYQAAGIKKMREHVKAGRKRIIFVAPTGSGKMYSIANIIKTSRVPVLFLAHRIELIDHLAQELRDLGITNVGVMRGDDDRTNPSASVQIASIATLIRREKPPAGIVIIDECHRSASDSYVDHVFNVYRDAIILGFTATPTRLDSKPLGSIYEALEVVATYQRLIKDGHIVSPLCFSTPLEPDLSKVHRVRGDYDEGELAEVMSDNALVGNVVDQWLKLAHRHPNIVTMPDGTKAANGMVDGPRRRTFLFAVNIKHSRLMCDRFTEAGVKIAHLDGNTPEAERREALRALGNGDIEIISNCNILLEGTNVPSAKCVISARPTQSLVLYRQSTGRIMRPWGDITPLLLDHAGNYERHGSPVEDIEWSLTTGPTRRKERIAPTRICRACFAYMAASRVICPYCGAELPSKPKELPRETKQDLVERTPDTEHQKRVFFDSMAALARSRGFKPGFAGAKWKDKYGVWPPWAWSTELKQEFSQDLQWQERLRAREEAKAKETEEDKAWASEAYEQPEAEESFGDWVDREVT